MNMINKNKKGRGEKIYGRRTSIDCGVKEALTARQDLAVGGKYGYPTSIVLRKVAGMGVMTVVGMGVMAVGLLWGARGAEAVR